LNGAPKSLGYFPNFQLVVVATVSLSVSVFPYLGTKLISGIMEQWVIS